MSECKLYMTPIIMVPIYHVCIYERNVFEHHCNKIHYLHRRYVALSSFFPPDFWFWNEVSYGRLRAEGLTRKKCSDTVKPVTKKLPQK